MSEKVYEMYDDYNQAVADLLEFIKIRDELAAAVKEAPPEKIREAQELLAQMDKKIEESEAALAQEYEAYQNQCRAEEERDLMFDEVMQRMEMVFIHIKYRHPEMLEELKSTIFNDWTPEEIEAFYDRVAILEATDLERIIAEDNEQ